MSHVRKFLDLSTAHLTAKTRHMLDTKVERFCCYHGEYGWFIWVPTEPEIPEYDEEVGDGYPADLIAAFHLARKMDCEYVMFDMDAEASDDLQTYDD
jgi:hypothetical protein